jgi:hypothetical protein
LVLFVVDMCLFGKNKDLKIVRYVYILISWYTCTSVRFKVFVVIIDILVI